MAEANAITLRSRIAPILRQLRRGLFVSVIALVITAGTVAALLRDPDGRAWLLHSALLIAKPYLGEIDIRITGTQSPAPGNWQFARLQVHYRQQLVAQFRDIELALDWRALQSQHLAIEQLFIGQLALYAIASAPNANESSGDPSGLLPGWLDLRPWQVDVENLQINELQWHDAVDTGELPATAITGSFSLWRDGLPWQGTIEAHSLPAKGTEVLPVLSLTVAGEVNSDQQLHISAQAHEDAGGWLGRRLQLPAQQALRVDTDLALSLVGNTYSVRVAAMQFPWLDHDCAARGELQLDRGSTSLQIKNLLLDIDQKRQHISGAVNGDRLQLDLVLDRLPLDVMRPWQPAISAGWATGKLSLRGPVDDLSLQAQGDYSLALIDANAALGQRWQVEGYVDGRLQFPHLQLEASRLSIAWQQADKTASAQFEAQGKLDFLRSQGGPYADLRGAINSLDSELIFALLRRFDLPLPDQLESLKAVASANTFSIRGDLGDGLRATYLAFNGDVTGSLESRPIALQLDAEGSWQRFQLRPSQLRLSDTSLNAEGAVDLIDSGNDFSIRISALDTELLRALPLEDRLPSGLTATINGAVSVSGRLAQPDANFDFDGSLRHEALGDTIALQLEGNNRGQQLVFERLLMYLPGTDNQPAAQWQLRGEMDWRTNIPAMHWQLRSEDFPLALFADRGWPDPDGQFSGDLQLRLPAADNVNTEWLSAVTLSGEFDYRSGRQLLPDSSRAGGVQTDSGKQWAVQGVRWAGNFTDSSAESDEPTIALQSSVELLGITAEEGTRTAGRLDIAINKSALAGWWLEGQQLPSFKLNTHMDLRAIGFLLPQGTDIEGSFSADVALSGQLRDPQVFGKLGLQDGGLTSSDLGITLHPISLQALASGRSLQLNALRAEDSRGGSIVGSGRLQWEELLAPDAIVIELSTDHLNLIEREDAQGDLTGTLRLRGNWQQAAVSGELLVEPLTVSIEGGAPGADIPDIDVNYEHDADSSMSPWLSTLGLDIQLRADRRAFLRGRGLNAELAGQVHLGGTVEKPVITGALDVVRGNFELFGNRFQLTDGRASLSNDSLVLLATGELYKGGTKITATLAGSNEQLDFTLTSDPEMPEDEILAWMMFGKTIDGISGAQAIQLATAVSTLRGGGFDPIGTTRDLLGVDTLTLDTVDTGTGTGVSIGAGKYLTERVYMELERSSEPTDPWRSNITIEMTPQLRLRSTLSTGSGSEGVELEWRRDF